jgi:hypothetical protein
MLWHLNRLIELAPDDWRHHARQAAAHSDSGEFDGAEAAYQRAGRLAAERLPDWYRHRAAVSYAEGRRQAGDWYVARLLRGGYDWQMIAARGQAAHAAGKAELGDGDWLRALPGADVRLILPALSDWATRGRWGYALAALRRLEQVRGPSASLDHQCGLAAAAAGDRATYESRRARLIGRLSERSPLDELDGALALAVLSDEPGTDWLALGELCDAALRRLSEADGKDAPPSLGRLLATRAWLWLRAGRALPALRAARQSVALRGGSRAWAALAVGHRREGRPEEAARCLKRAEGVRQEPWLRAEADLLRKAAEAEVGR